MTMKVSFITLLVSFLSFTVYSQTAISLKDSLNLVKLERYVIRAKAMLEKAEAKMAYADSLILVGLQMVEDGESADKELEVKGKQQDKTYAQARKVLEKETKSKNSMEAKEAKAKLKILDNQNKADTKTFLTTKKALIKQISKGEYNVAKGKMYKKDAKYELKIATEALEEAEQNLEKNKMNAS